jgi:ankyrin repeat protein
MPQVTKFLIESGADLSIKDNRGLTPLDWAIKNNDLGITQLIISKLLTNEVLKDKNFNYNNFFVEILKKCKLDEKQKKAD